MQPQSKDRNSNTTVSFSTPGSVGYSPLEQFTKTLQLLQLPEEICATNNQIRHLDEKMDRVIQYLEKGGSVAPEDGYMSPEEAREYLGMSQSTFDKYRYKTKIRIPSYQLDGKCWFKKSDLDRFMLTYKIKQLQ